MTTYVKNELKVYAMILLTMTAGFVTLFFGEYILDEMIKQFPKAFIILSIWGAIGAFGAVIYTLWPSNEKGK